MTLWLRWRLPFLIFIVGTIAIVALSQPIGRYLFKNEVEKRLSNIHTFYQDRYLSVGIELKKLEQELQFTCTKEDIAILRDTMEESTGIQLIELHTSNTDCSVYGENVSLIKDFNDDTSAIDHDTPAFSYEITPYHNHRLKIHYQLPSASILLITEPVINVFTQSEVCFGCTSMTLSRGGKEIPVYPKQENEFYKLIASSPVVPNYHFNVYATTEGIDYVARNDLVVTQLLLFFMLLSVCLLVGLSRSDEQTLKGMITQGIYKQEFVPYYQPIINTQTGKMTCCEVLIRWKRTNGELISPNQFIPIAEHNGQIKLLTQYLLKQVFTDFQDELANDTGFYFSINVTPQQLEDEAFFHSTIKQLEQSNVPAHRLAFEVTERTPFTDLNKARQIIQQLTDYGISIKLDDAGTGYGGFSYLQKLPIDTLKIDKMFIDTIGTNDLKSNILDSIILFAKHAGLKVIAEGVETAAQVEYLHQRDIHLMQGFYFAKPMPFQEFHQYLQQDLKV